MQFIDIYVKLSSTLRHLLRDHLIYARGLCESDIATTRVARKNVSHHQWDKQIQWDKQTSEKTLPIRSFASLRVRNDLRRWLLKLDKLHRIAKYNWLIISSYVWLWSFQIVLTSAFSFELMAYVIFRVASSWAVDAVKLEKQATAVVVWV